MSELHEDAEVRADTRRRIVVAFVTRSGSDEVSVGSRSRLLAAGVVAAVLLLVGGAVRGRSTTSHDAWSDGAVVVGRASAERFVSVHGVLHPLLNAASGRLLSPPGSGARVALVDDATIASVRRGEPIGISGAPDVLPASSSLVPTGWVACLEGDRVRTRISSTLPSTRIAATPAVVPSSGASPTDGPEVVVVAVDGRRGDVEVVTGDHRYRIPAASYPAVTQYLGQTRSPMRAPPEWISLFPAGTDLAFDSFRFGASSPPGQPVSVPLRVSDTMMRVGQLLTMSDRVRSGDGESFLLVADGTVPLTPFAAAVYRATAPADLGVPLAVTDADLARLPPSPVAGLVPADWPAARPPLAPSVGSGAAPPVPCAELDAGSGRSPVTHLRLAPASAGQVSTPTPVPTQSPVTTLARAAPAPAAPAPLTPELDPDGGAVVVVTTGPEEDMTVYLVDPAGRAFPVGDPFSEVLGRLGYPGVVPSRIPAAWVALCPAGPLLSVAAAQLSTGSAVLR